MPFDNTGKGHRTAIEDEKRFFEWLNAGGHRYFDWGEAKFTGARLEGGVTKVEDVVATTNKGEVKFSCKLARSGLERHSHTYLNTSKIITQLKKANDPCVGPIIALEAFRDGVVNSIPDVTMRKQNRATYAEMMRQACSDTLAQLTDDIIGNIFRKSMEHTLSMDWIVVFDQPNQIYYWWKPESHPASEAARDTNWTVTLLPFIAGSESANLLLTSPDGSEERDLKLRLRVKTNNGVSDLFKMGSSNSCSFVTTIQQDPGSLPDIFEWMKEKNTLHHVSAVLPASRIWGVVGTILLGFVLLLGLVYGLMI